MRLTALITLLCFTAFVFSQSFTDDFSDGELGDPLWSGDVVSYSAVTGELQLQGDCVAGGENYLSSAVSTKDSAVWSFYVRCEFDPSTSNYAKVYLQSDNADLKGELNGYYVQIGGESGSTDAVKLYRQDGTDKSLVLTGGEGSAATAPELGIKVIRSIDGEWKLYIDYTGGTDYIFETSAFDTEINGGSFMGVDCIYTSTRCDLFYFDNFYADPLYTDTEAPSIVSLTVLSSTQLEVQFSENVELISAESESNYSVDHGVGSPLNASRNVTDNRKVTLTFAGDFPSGLPLILTVSNIEDAAGNTLVTDVAGFSFYTAQLYDVIIDEIFADETPVIGLPEAEYIELYNTTATDIDLTGFTFSDGSSLTDAFPSFILQADSFVIVTDDGNAGLFDSYGQVIYIGSFPALNNDGDNAQLFDAGGNLLYNANYNTDWYHDALKEEGGYSLEMIDTHNPCQGEENWRASADVGGGTPGRRNSVAADNPDETAPSLVSVYPPADDSLIIYFDEAIETASLSTAVFSVDNGMGEAVSATINNSTNTSVKLSFSTTFSAGVLYTLTVTGIKDCSGNEALINNTIEFGIASPAESMDIVINEILFNPVSNGYDYVELYNRSDKFIDLAQLNLAEYDPEDTTAATEITAVSETPRLFLPATYILITADIDQTASAYFVSSTDNFIENSGMPNYPDDEGIAGITNAAGETIDKLHYYHTWHFPLVDDENGVSLERLNYDAATQDENNWHSAAEDKHYGTPGSQNSIFGDISNGEDIFSLEYEVFSPDGDGYHDYLVMQYNTPAEGYVAAISIFDAQGRLIKQVANNTQIAREGFFTWDGLNNDNDKARMGIYIAYAELFNLDGTTTKEKLKFTLVRK